MPVAATAVALAAACASAVADTFLLTDRHSVGLQRSRVDGATAAAIAERAGDRAAACLEAAAAGGAAVDVAGVGAAAFSDAVLSARRRVGGEPPWVDGATAAATAGRAGDPQRRGVRPRRAPPPSPLQLSPLPPWPTPSAPPAVDAAVADAVFTPRRGVCGGRPRVDGATAAASAGRAGDPQRRGVRPRRPPPPSPLQPSAHSNRRPRLPPWPTPSAPPAAAAAVADAVFTASRGVGEERLRVDGATATAFAWLAGEPASARLGSAAG